MTHDEFKRLYKANTRLEGRVVYLACCFCAAPNFLVYNVIDTQRAVERGGVCEACGRGARGIFTRTEIGVALEMVQVSGDDPPFYIAIRRVQ